MNTTIIPKTDGRFRSSSLEITLLITITNSKILSATSSNMVCLFRVASIAHITP